MKKKLKDKIITIFGVLILILASIGIYILNVEKIDDSKLVGIEAFYEVTGKFSNLPNAISISDSNPFFALITTPLAVHYNQEGKQQVLPLYIKNTTEPSSAIIKAEKQIDITANFVIDTSLSAKSVSLSVAEKFGIAVKQF